LAVPSRTGAKKAAMAHHLIRRSAVALVTAFAISACSNTVGYAPVPSTPSTPPLASIRHVIVLVQENRSFVNLFMGYPGADAPSKGACKPNHALNLCLDGQPVPLKPITLETTGMPGGTDIGHDHKAFEIEFDGGKMDGFNSIPFGTASTGPPAKLYPYAYVEKSETQPYWNLAKAFTLGDRMFSTETSDSFVAHQQLVAGTTRLNASESLVDTPNSFPWGCDAPSGTEVPVIKVDGTVVTNSHVFPCITQYKTMADVLDAANVSWKFYVDPFEGANADFSGEVWNSFDPIKAVRYGPDWKKNVSEPNTNIFTDIKSKKLAAVSWVIPSLADSDHPASGSNTGPSWVTSVVNAVGKSSYWNNTAIVVVWDDWGGWYDNFPPAQPDYTSLGMRVPLLVISPWAKHGYVSKTEYNFGSILKYIEQNFDTGSLGTTDASANSIGDVFNFTQAPPGFHPFAAPYEAKFFLRHRPEPSARWFMERSGAVPD
jgi:phospholipase C